jgi:hypothetical protein
VTQGAQRNLSRNSSLEILVSTVVEHTEPMDRQKETVASPMQQWMTDRLGKSTDNGAKFTFSSYFINASFLEE